MKNTAIELDVDFIGGQGPMTKEEEATVSEFIKAEKEKRRMQEERKTKKKTTSKQKQTA